MFRSLGSLLILLTQAGVEAKPVELRVGFSTGEIAFEEHFQKKDILIATRVLIKQTMSADGAFVPVFNEFENNEDLIKAVIAGKLDYFDIPPKALVQLAPEIRELITPIAVVQLGEDRLEKMVLLAPPGKSIEDLKGAKVRVYSGRDRKIGGIWLNRVVSEATGRSVSAYFGSVETFATSERVILPTFFGKADACLVRLSDYSVAVELNPQIGKQLVPLATSPGFPFVVTAVHRSVHPKITEQLRDKVTSTITSTKKGRQAFDLLGVKDLSNLEEGDLDGLEELMLWEQSRIRGELSQTGSVDE